MITNTESYTESQLIEHYNSVVMGYVEEVLDGRLVTGLLEQSACQRYLDDVRDDGHRFRLNKLKAAKACAFFPKLRHTQGSYKGKRFHLYPIQAFMIWNIFGWENLHDEFRRFREAYVSMGRGNGKTPLGAGVALKVTGFDTPTIHRANTYLTATKKDQAGIAFADLKAYIRASGIESRCSIKADEIRFLRTDSTIEPLPADSETNDGLRIYFLLRDEIHAFKEEHRNFYNVLETGLDKYDQTLALTITTAGNENSLIWKEQDSIATMVVERDNSFRIDELFVMICRLDAEDDVFDIDNYGKSNPLMRHAVVKQSKIEKLIKEAKILPSKKRSLTRYYANRQVESSVKSITAEMWNRSVCRGERRMPVLSGVPNGGLDMGQTDDLAAIAFCWRLGDVSVADRDKDGLPKVDSDTGELLFVDQPTFAGAIHVFCAAANENLKKEPLCSWADAGYLTATDSEWTDPAAIYRQLQLQVNATGVGTLAYDPNNCKEFALNCINDYGVDAQGFLQRYDKFNEPFKMLKRAMVEGRVFLPDNPVLEWCFRNVVEKENTSGHIMPDKHKSPNKIDPFVAFLMAFSEAVFGPAPTKSVYETRGVISF